MNALTAQEFYKLLINQCISPTLHDDGFKGSAGKYTLPHPRAFILIGFQKNKWNMKNEVSFTVNVSVIEKGKWEVALKEHPWMEQVPKPSVDYPVEMWTQRLAMIPEGASDKWWKINSESNIETIAQDILDRIRKDALPAIEKRINQTLE